MIIIYEVKREARTYVHAQRAASAWIIVDTQGERLGEV